MCCCGGYMLLHDRWSRLRFSGLRARSTHEFHVLSAKQQSAQCLSCCHHNEQRSKSKGCSTRQTKQLLSTLPTSGGKTVLAQFRMLQALNQFADDDGWVAYVAPTRALVSQITRRLRTDFEPLGI